MLTSTSIGSRVGPGCPEPALGGLLSEPVAAVTSLAFVVAALAIPRTVRHVQTEGVRAEIGERRSVRGYSALVGAVGFGSLVQHGPDPSWADLAHDLPLVATVLFVGADAGADLSGRRRRWWWWAVPTLALVPVVARAPVTADVAQAVAAAGAVVVTLVRARKRPRLRRHIATAVALLASGATIGTLSRAGWPLCAPGSMWQGHAVWHLLAAAALVVLSPVIGRGTALASAEPTGPARFASPVTPRGGVGGQSRRVGRS